MTLNFGPRRGEYLDLRDGLVGHTLQVSPELIAHLDRHDLIYRSLCALLFNYAPLSGHPGGSISAGRHLASLLYATMVYDFTNPLREGNDLICFAAGHKALGLYAMWAIRDEIVRLGAPELVPSEEKFRLRLEDLLGFRKNPITQTELFQRFSAKPLDGHPTPATPFVPMATGASGVGLTSAVGLAIGALDVYGSKAPRVHVLEGEGGMTPGRVSEAMATAGTASVKNLVLHVDWNQAAIDSNAVCRDGERPGDYVQWSPQELAYLHDWNVVDVPDGMDFEQIALAQQCALQFENDQPTAIVYRTTKGWRYGITGKDSHGAGHKLCSPEYYETLTPLADGTGIEIPTCDRDEDGNTKCKNASDSQVMERCCWQALSAIREYLERETELVDALAKRVIDSRKYLETASQPPLPNGPDLEKIFHLAKQGRHAVPDELELEAGVKTTLRGELGRVLSYLNQLSNGAVIASAADLFGSTSVRTINKGFPEGYLNFATNRSSRLLPTGGICEDAMTGILSGLAVYGRHLGVGSSYGAFSAPLGHIAARLHAIGCQARRSIDDGPFRPFMIVCAHAGVKTGEDGPTHADPQALQLLQRNFPKGTLVTLTPWDPAEIWHLVTAALEQRPAVIAAFITRPQEVVVDRSALRLAPISASKSGVYRLYQSEGERMGTVVLQGSEVGTEFVNKTLPMLRESKIDVDVFYVASAELFDLMPEDQKESIFPTARGLETIGISGFTAPTMEHWVRSDLGRRMSLNAFSNGHYLGSGKAEIVLKEAGLDGESQFVAIRNFVLDRKQSKDAA